MARFYERLFCMGIAEVGSCCPLPMLEAQPGADHRFDQVLLARWQWRIDELPGILSLTPTPADLGFFRELARRFYQSFYLCQFQHTELFERYFQQCATPLIAANACQIVAADAICYDGLSLLTRIDRTLMLSQSDENSERAPLWSKFSAVFAQLLQQSPLTAVRELHWPLELTPVMKLVFDTPVLAREACDYLAFPGAQAARQQIAAQLLTELGEAGYQAQVDYVLKMRAHFTGEDSAWTRRFQTI